MSSFLSGTLGESGRRGALGERGPGVAQGPLQRPNWAAGHRGQDGAGRAGGTAAAQRGGPDSPETAESEFGPWLGYFWSWGFGKNHGSKNDTVYDGWYVWNPFVLFLNFGMNIFLKAILIIFQVVDVHDKSAWWRNAVGLKRGLIWIDNKTHVNDSIETNCSFFDLNFNLKELLFGQYQPCLSRIGSRLHIWLVANLLTGAPSYTSHQNSWKAEIRATL